MAENKKKPVTDEIAGVETDIFRDYLGKIIVNPDKVIKSESGGKGLEIYEDLLRDDKVGSTLQTRKLAITGKEWEVIPASDDSQDVKIADFVKEVFLNFDYDSARKVLLSGLVTGFKPGEIMWDYSEGDIWIKEIIGRSPRRFVFDLKRNMRMLTFGNMIEGEELPERKFIIFRNESDNGSPYGDGLGKMLYWPVWFKKNGIKFWMIFADKFGSPTSVGKYPPGTEKSQQNALLDALEAIQQESAIKIPNTMTIELLEAARQGTINTYEGLCNFMNNAIAQVMLGQTLTSEIGDKGSYAASQTHESVREDYVKADADMLCECQNNSLVKWTIDYNFPDVKKYPKVWIRTELEKNLKPLAERDKILAVDIGVPVTKEYFYETYGIPQPEEGEELITTPSPQPAMPSSFSVIPAMSGISLKDSGQAGMTNILSDQKDIETLADNSLKVAAPTFSGRNLQNIINSAESYEDLQKKIKTAYGTLDLKEFREILERAMFMAEMKGRSIK